MEDENMIVKAVILRFWKGKDTANESWGIPMERLEQIYDEIEEMIDNATTVKREHGIVEINFSKVREEILRRYRDNELILALSMLEYKRGMMRGADGVIRTIMGEMKDEENRGYI